VQSLNVMTVSLAVLAISGTMAPASACDQGLPQTALGADGKPPPELRSFYSDGSGDDSVMEQRRRRSSTRETGTATDACSAAAPGRIGDLCIARALNHGRNPPTPGPQWARQRRIGAKHQLRAQRLQLASGAIPSESLHWLYPLKSEKTEKSSVCLGQQSAGRPPYQRDG